MNSLFARSVAALLGILVCIGLATTGITWWTTERYQQEATQRLNTTIADYVVATQNLMEGDRVNENALKEIAHMVMVINPSIEVYLLDPTGKVVGHALPESAITNLPIGLDPIKAFIANPERLPVYGDDPRNPKAKKVFSAAAVTNDNGVITGYLYAILVGESHLSTVRGLRNSLIIKNGVVAVAALMAFALLAGLLIFYVLTRRLHRLVSAFNTFRENGFSQVVNAEHRQKRHDEIDTLAVTFNHMSKKIVCQMHELRQTDRRRRELMQNISHDLRTPLASMQGYIDTLYLKYDELSEEQRREYLETAGRNGRHLGKLVKELFELSNLDAGILTLKREPFSMAELVQDIVQKFKLDAARRGITLEIDIEKTSALVAADIGLLERVLENLIDNALKHTNSSGVVRVSLKKHHNKIITTVFDSGEGISSDDLPRIFERTFVSKAGDPNRQRGTGLGLAIVKKILDLHDSKIEVTSKLGHGSAFSFALECAT